MRRALSARASGLRTRVAEGTGLRRLKHLRARVERLEVGFAEEQALLDGLEHQVRDLEGRLAAAYLPDGPAEGKPAV